MDGTGCGDGRLCPNEAISRSEMAVWLVRVLDEGDPPPADTTRFDDVDDSVWWAAHTERLYELEVTFGCATDPLRFCPDTSVTRAQTAAFLHRAINHQQTTPITGTASPNTGGGGTGTGSPGPNTGSLGGGTGQTASRHTYKAVSAGKSHVCGIRSDDGTIACWGSKLYGHTDAPLGAFKAVDAGWNISCGLRADKSVVCWARSPSTPPNPDNAPARPTGYSAPGC